MSTEAGLAGLAGLADERSGFCAQPIPLALGFSPLAPVVCASKPLHMPEILAACGCNSTLSRTESEPLFGVGHRATWSAAAQIAAAEAAERYAAAIFPDDEPRWASASELGDAAYPLDQFPECSPTELAQTDCPLSPLPGPDARIRWTKAADLLSGRDFWIPTVMVALGLVPESEGERFWHQTSSGCAVHVDAASAAQNAILELIERDSTAITWLQQLRLPRVNTRLLSPRVRAELTRREGLGIETVLLDARTDIDIPTVYAIEVAPRSALTRHVAAASAAHLTDAAEHALNELAVSRYTVLQHEGVPSNPRECRSVIDGATYLGDAARAPAFDFLLEAAHEQVVIRPRSVSGLPDVLDRLAGRVEAVLLVDITTAELNDAGLVAVRAVIPDLMPISFDHRARYLGTPRLYDLPALLGHDVQPEERLNPWPQPFA